MYNLKPVSFGTTGVSKFSKQERNILDIELLKMIRIFNYHWENHPIDKYIFEKNDKGKLRIVIDGFNVVNNQYEKLIIDFLDEIFLYKEITLTIDEYDDYYLGMFDLNKIT